MTKNPLLEELYDAEVIQTTELALPTLGRFYPEGVIHPDADVSAIEVSPIGIVSELRLNDPFIMASGRATPRIIKAVAPAILMPEKLCSIDVNALLLATRIVSHGPKMEIDVRCQNPAEKKGVRVCQNEDKISVDLLEMIMRYAPISDEDMAQFIIELPLTKHKVCIKPPSYDRAIAALKTAINANRAFTEIKKKTVNDLIDDAVTASQYEELIDMSARASIETLVDQIFYVESRAGAKFVEPEVIVEWLERIPPDDVRVIQDRMTDMGKSLLDLNQVTYQCSNCGHENRIYMTLDPQQLFFYKSEASTPPKKSSSSTTKRGRGGKRPSRTSQR